MALFHLKTNTIADWTGTVTVGDSAGGLQTANATDLVRPGDWNSGHLQQLTLTGNTAGASTLSGTNIVLAATNGVQFSASQGTDPQATLSVLQAPITGWVPWYPASTGAMSLVGNNSIWGSIHFLPFYLPVPVAFNAIRFLSSASYITSSASFTQQYGCLYAIMTNSGGTVSSLYSNFFLATISGSSISATGSLQMTTSASGYSTGSTTYNATNAIQSGLGTAFPRLFDLAFGADITLQPGSYWFAQINLDWNANAVGGMKLSRYGNVVNTQHTNAVPVAIGANDTSNFSRRLPGFGVWTATRADFSGGFALSQIKHSLTQIPLMSFTST